jgi:acetyl-CoA carboxylase carboxyl transferase subunit alpha
VATYLDFEQKIKRIEEDIENAKIKGDEAAIEILKEDLEKEVAKTYKNLTPYQKLQLARHPDRLYAKDYIRALMKDSYEIHGDRHYRDDSSIVAYIGYIDGVKSMIIGEQKGRGTKNKLKRNFGMPHPEGYRKALRVAKLAEKFHIPILMLVDTPGAYPGIGAEERGQSEAIAKNLQEFSKLDTITVSIVIGEGGSGGALAIAVADKLAMMRYSVFSVISPEGCAAILWDDPTKIENATEAMKITSEELYEHKLINDIVNEPLIGAHRNRPQAIAEVKNYYLNSLNELNSLSKEERLQRRYDKLMSYGSFNEE